MAWRYVLCAPVPAATQEDGILHESERKGRVSKHTVLDKQYQQGDHLKNC